MELLLSDIKTITFEILKKFRTFCEENHIRFYLSNGTLLGAVKYGGFIPWDDDIDVLVPREDYDRLIKIYQDDERYRLFSIEREPDFRYTFAKLCDMRTIKKENNINNGVRLGIDIDIFPLDNCTEHILIARVQLEMRFFQIGCSLSKFYKTNGIPLHKRCVIWCCRLLGFNYFYNRLANLVCRERNLGANYKGCLMWPIYGEHEIIPAQVFEDIVEVKFEGEYFSAPVGYDIYLRSLYGDYWQDLPKEKQKTHHKFKAYRIN